ncbi:hypothetical protein AAKU55_001223 [Oxalobacteraceae bacterium GrIS 1.11]
MATVLFSYVSLCLIVAFLGRKSRIGVIRTFLLSLMLTPLVGFIYLLLFATIDERERNSNNDHGNQR